MVGTTSLGVGKVAVDCALPLHRIMVMCSGNSRSSRRTRMYMAKASEFLVVVG